MSAGLSGLSIALYGGLSTWVARDLQLQHVHSGLAQAVFYGGNLASVAFAGKLLARYRTALLWPAALALLALGNFATGSPHFGGLLLGRFVAGLGIASLFLILTDYLVRRRPQQRVRYLSLLHATTAASAALSLACGRGLAEAFGGWKPVFWAGSGATLAMAVLVAWSRIPSGPATDQDTVATDEGAMPTTRRDIPLWRAIAVLWGYVALEQGLTVFLPVLGERAFAIAPAKAPMLAATLWAGVIVGRLVSASIRAIPEHSMLICGGLGMAYFLLLGLGANDVPALAACVFGAGVMGGPIVPAAYGLASRVSPRHRPTTISLCQFGSGFGGFSGPFVVGLAGDSLGLTPGLGLLSFLLFASASTLLIPMVRGSIAPALDRVRAIGRPRVTEAVA